MTVHDCPTCTCDADDGYDDAAVLAQAELPCTSIDQVYCADPWCPRHAQCPMCDGPLVITEGDPAFCTECQRDVMPVGACTTGDAADEVRRG